MFSLGLFLLFFSLSSGEFFSWTKLIPSYNICKLQAVSRIEVGKQNLSATFEQSSKYQGLQNRGTNSANDVKISSLDEEGPQCTTSISN